MKTVDLFSGCGGLSLGLEMSGFEILAAYENWDAAVKIYNQNFNHPVYNFDLSNVDDAIDQIGQLNPDIIVGGPPCQDFSSAGKRNDSGTRGDLTLSFAEIIKGVRPKWFLMENVERIQKSKVFFEAKTVLKNVGYGFTELVLDASRCGVPQKRKRMFLIGQINTPDNFLENALLNGLSNKSLTVREYMGGELEIENYYRHARSYARRGVFSIDEPSPTIRGVNRPIPPSYVCHAGDSVKNLEEVRPLTTIERSLIQSFPKNFNWDGVSKTALEQIIGNAVPVNLARYVGNCIINYKKEENGVLNFTSEISQLDSYSFS